MNLTYYDTFWQRYINLIHSEMIPNQWKVLHDEGDPSEKSNAMENLRIAAGLSDGNHYG